MGNNTPPSGHLCTQSEIMERIEGKLDAILDRLGKGDTAIALLEHRVNGLEKIVYGLSALILVAVAGAMVSVVIIK